METSIPGPWSETRFASGGGPRTAERPGSRALPPDHAMCRTLSLAALCALLLASCVDLRGYVPATFGPERVVERNFTLGEEREVARGEPLVRAREYLLTRRELPDAVASADFTVRGGNVVIRLQRGHAYPIVGQRRTSRGPVFVVEVDGTYALQVDAEGVVDPTVLHERVPLAPRFQAHPADARLVPGEERTVEPAPGAKNIEILYDGLAERDAFGLVYRELRADGALAPAGEQRLAYSRDTDEVRLHGFTLRVLHADAAHLRFVVVSAPRELTSAPTAAQ